MFKATIYEQFIFILIMTIHQSFYGQTLKTNEIEANSSICGLSKVQVQGALSYSKKYPFNGISIDSNCLVEGHKINFDKCLTEQNQLIHCLQKELLSIREQRKALSNKTNSSTTNIISKQQGTESDTFQDIITSIKDLEVVTEDHDEIIVSHLQSIDYLKEMQSLVDNLSFALINTKVELTTIILQRIMNNNMNTVCILGIYPKLGGSQLLCPRTSACNQTR